MLKNRGGRPTGLHHKYLGDKGELDSAGRRPCSCAYCDHEYPAMRPEQVWKHILDECKGATAETRVAARDDCASKAEKAEAPAPKRTRRSEAAATSKSAGSTQRSAAQYAGSSGAVTPQNQRDFDLQCLRAFVHAGLAFNAVENPYMVDLFQSLRPKWLVPGRSKLANLLISEDARAEQLLAAAIAVAIFICLTLDGWTAAANQSVYASNVVCEGDKGRSSAFYDAQDFSEEHHTGEFIAEAIYEWALKIGPQKLVAVITDNAPAMVKARRLFVEKEGMGHIIPIRCHMHGVNLCLEGVLVGEFAKNISSQGQVVATFIRASPIAAAKVAAAAKQLNMQGTVLSGNSTRFTSVVRMLDSLSRLRAALVAAVDAEPDVFKPAVRRTLTDRDFWDDLAALLPILRPLETAITQIQGLDATLADVLLHWIRAAAAIQKTLPRLPRDYRVHLVGVFNSRCIEMDSVLHHLTLFLDPRYREAVIARGQLSQLIEKAKEIMQTRVTASQLSILVTELTAYSLGMDPFSPSYMPSASMSVKQWWLSLNTPSQASIIVTLAVLLYSIVPHAAGNERDFSIMKWLNPPRRACQSVPTLKRLTRVRTSLSTLVSKPRRIMISEEGDDAEEVQVELSQQLLEDLDDEGDAMEPAQLDQAFRNCQNAVNAELQAAMAAGAFSFTELLMADDVDLESAAWQPGYVHVSAPATSQLVGLVPLSTVPSAGQRVVTRGLG